MANSRQPAGFKQILSDDLWASIFLHLKPDVQSEANIDIAPSFYSLPLVCHEFRTAFRASPCLHSDLVVGLVQGLNIKSLLEWIEQHAIHIQHIDLTRSPISVAVLTALQQQQSCHLHTVTYRDLCYTAEVQLSAAFKTMSHCTFIKRELGIMSLQPLRALPNLVNLTLTGSQYNDMEDLCHLTSLTLRDTQVDCSRDCKFASSLVQLSLNDSHLLSFHQSGVCACAALRSLTCCKSTIDTDGGDDDFSAHYQYRAIPTGLSALNALTCLHFGYSMCSVFDTSLVLQVVALDWVTRLASLKSLELCIYSAVHNTDVVQVPEVFSVLSQLSHLSIRCTQSVSCELPLDWSTLPALQIVLFAGPFKFCFVKDLSCLAPLHSLRSISFVGCDFGLANNAATKQLMSLCYRLGRRNPQVFLSM